MKKEDIIRKLTSRKFWLAVASFVTMILVYCGQDSGKAEQLASLIMAGASIVAYLLAEGWADRSNKDD